MRRRWVADVQENEAQKLDLQNWMIGDSRHCDDYIDDITQPACLRQFLEFQRLPAIDFMQRLKDGEPLPVLFATMAHTDTNGGCTLQEGTRVRVTMASRLGDVGVTRNFEAEDGYEMRMPLDSLKDFSESME